MRALGLIGIVATLSFSPVEKAGAEQAIVIGGGNNANTSSDQIESNIRWLQQVLSHENIPVTTYFTDGNDAAPDISYIQSTTSEADSTSTSFDKLAEYLEPLARVFNDHNANATRFRNHQVENVQGSTKADALTVALTEKLKANPNQPHLFVINGHGKQKATETSQGQLELWDNTGLSVSEFQNILNNSNGQSRFVLSQCNSGTFHRLAYQNADSGTDSELMLSSAQRCGFTSETANHSNGVSTIDARTDGENDYATSFFSAINGYGSNGRILPVDTDFDDNGEVSLREAHFYTLEHMHNTNLPSSTSEDFLRSWQPWHLRWATGRSNIPNNEYAKLFRNLATKLDVPLDKNVAKTIRLKIESHQQAINGLDMQLNQFESRIIELQNKLIEQATTMWPALTTPYTARYQNMVASGEIVNASNWMGQQPDYAMLTELQTQTGATADLRLKAERDLTQLQKLIGLRTLAKLKHQLYEFGSPSEINSYEQLLHCEEQPLNFDTTDQSNIFTEKSLLD